MNCSRPDIAIAVNLLCRQAQCPRIAHLRLAKGIIRYLRNNLQWKLKFTPLTTSVEVTAFCDANFYRHSYSTIGYIIYLNNNVFKYQVKRLKRIVTSTTLAELLGCFCVVVELYSLLQTFQELQIKFRTPKVFCDNKAAILVTKTTNNCKVTRDLELQQLRLREHFRNGTFEIEYISTSENVADTFTKVLQPSQFKYLREKYMVPMGSET